MSSISLLKKLSENYSQTEVRQLVECLRLDPLVWQFVDSDYFPESLFALAAKDPRYWTPGNLALFLLKSDEENYLNIPLQIDQLNETLVDKIEVAYEAFKVTCIPPDKLETAGLLALSIARYHQVNNNWEGIGKLFLNKANFSVKQSLNYLWKSIFACLPSFIKDFISFSIALINESPDRLVFQSIQLIQHGVLTQYADISSREDIFSNIFGNQHLNFQTKFLQSLQESGQTGLMQHMANVFLAKDDNLKSIGEFFSQTEGTDESLIDSNLLTNLSTQAQLIHYAGLPEKSNEFQAKIIELQSKNLASQYHNLAIESACTNPPLAKSAFVNALRYNPNAEEIKLDFLELLAKNQDAEELPQLLDQIKDKITARFIVFAYLPEFLQSQKFNPIQIIHDFYNSGYDNKKFKKDALEKTIDYLTAEGKTTSAEKIVGSLLLEFPNDPVVIEQASRVEILKGRKQEALAYNELLHLYEPENKIVQTKLVNLYAETGQWKKAFDLQDAIISNTTSPSHNDLLKYAKLAIETNQTDLAISICQNMLSLDQLDGEALVILGNAFIRSGNTKAAIEQMEKAASLAPESAASWLALANIWTLMDDHAKALDTLLKAKSALPDNFLILFSLGEAYLKNDLASNAIPILKQAFRINPDDVIVRTNLANAQLTVGQIDEAWDLLSSIKNSFAQSTQLALIIGKVLVAKEKYVDAYPYLKFAYHGEKSKETVTSYANLLIHVKNSEVFAINPDEILEEINSIEKTLDHLIIKNSDSFELMLLGADLKLVKGDSQNAYNNYLSLAEHQASKSPGNYARVQHGIGKSALAEKKFQVSLAALQEAVLSNPTDPLLRQTLAKVYFASGMTEEARDSANSSIKIAPDDISNLVWYLDFSKEIGSVDSAINAVRNAMVRFPNETRLNIALADLFLTNNQHEQATSIIDKLIENKSIGQDDIHQAIDLLFRLNQGEKAKSLLENSLSSDNNLSFSLLHNLCHHLINSEDNLGALEVIAKFEDHFANDERFKFLHVDIMTASQKYEEALQILAPTVNLIKSGRKIPNENQPTGSLVDFEKMYSDDSAVSREVSLHILKGDWLVAKENSAEAKALNSNSATFAYQNLSILFSLMDWENFNKLYVHLESEPWFNNLSSEQSNILNWMRFEIAFKQNDLEKCDNITSTASNEDSDNLLFLAAKIRLEVNANRLDIAISVFEKTLQLYEDRLEEKSDDLVSELYNFDQIWAPLSLANAAKDLMKWDIANELCSKALRLQSANPLANFISSEILCYMKMAQIRNNDLLIYTHSPKFDTTSTTFSELLSEQFSKVERFIEPSKLDDLSFLVRAISENEIDTEELNSHIKCVNDAIAILPLCPDSQSAVNIRNSYKGNFNVEFAYAVQLFKLQPEKCQQILPELFNQNTTHPQLHFLQAMCYQRDPVLSKQALENALSQWPDEPYWHAQMAKIEFNNNKFDSASKHLEVAIDILPDEPDFWQTLGDVKQKEKDFEAAKSYFAQAIDIFPNNPAALYSLAMMNRKLGDFWSAISCLEKAQALEPTDKKNTFALASIYYEAGAHQKAIQLSENLIDEYPAEITPRVTYLRTLIADKQVDKAAKILSDWKKAFPNYTELDLIEAQIVSRLKSNTDALSLLSDLANKHPEDIHTMHAYADSLIKENYLDEAEKILQQALSIDPDDAKSYLSLGRLKKHKGQLDQALSMFSKSIAIDPGTESAYIELGKTYQERREHQQAVKVYEQGAEIFPESPTLYYLAGIAYKECKDYKSSEIMLRKAAQLDPDDTLIRRQLAGVITMNLVHSLQEPRKL